ncbi:TNF receptor-associated factor 4-like [Montipora foliosa]|uniref:TNF receptor-associated factor 4-like n=1 Tax=Montipora foliosa TaxID=591990 RepID=UPI0035F14607
MAEAQVNSSFGGYDDEFVEVVEDDLLCPICHLPLKRPVQTESCGHRFCRQCIDRHFKSQETNRQPLTCPMDQTLSRQQDIFLDRATERKILSLIIKCPSEGCQWTGELRAKNTHLTHCPHKVVSCTNDGCRVTLPRRALQEHLTSTCDHRIICCSFCDTSHHAFSTESHRSVCGKFPVDCPNACGSREMRERVLDHIENQCTLTVISCPYSNLGCSSEFQRRDRESHLQSDMPLHLDLACVRLINTEEKLRATQEKISALENRPLPCHKYTWKINGFQEILRRAKVGLQDVIHSDPFYTEQCGYKIKFRLYPNGVEDAQNIHLSLFFIIMKGEYDAILQWPFAKPVTLTLIDQQGNPDDRENIVRSFSNYSGSWCTRPVREENLGNGFTKFVSHDNLKKRAYIVDDAIFIEAKFD